MSNGKYAVLGDYLAQEANGCTCFGGDAHYGHEPGCGWEPIAKIAEIEAALRAVHELRKLHVYVLDCCDEYVCGDCGQNPCPTLAAINPT